MAPALLLLATTCTALLTVATAAAAQQQQQQQQPDVYGLNATALVLVRTLIEKGTLPQRLQPALEQLVRSADSALLMRGHGKNGYGCPEQGPWSVVNKQVVPPSGDKHDFTFLTTYGWPCNAECNLTQFTAEHCKDWWRRPSWMKNTSEPYPDWSQCNNATGLPWIGHDGFGQPLGQHDTDCSVAMSDTVETLSQAYFLTQNETYAEGAANVFRTWFINPATAMNPNMQFAAYNPGHTNGSAGGEIATTCRWTSKVTDSAALLSGSANWRESDVTAMNKWNAAYLEWLLRPSDSEYEATNNHFTWLLVESLSLALSTGNSSVAQQLVDRATSEKSRGCLQSQISKTGVMMREATREAGASYSSMNMRALFSLAQVASHVPAATNLWNYRDGGTTAAAAVGAQQQKDRPLIRKALDYLLAFATNSSAHWPWKQDGSDTPWDKFPWASLAPVMRRAAIVYRDERYEQSIEQLPWNGARSWESDPSQLLWPRL
jgi:hypothetical protein